MSNLIKYNCVEVGVIEELESTITRLREQLKNETERRPQWAKGYSNDSVAAQCSTSALHAIWKALGVDNQTQAMQVCASFNVVPKTPAQVPPP